MFRRIIGKSGKTEGMSGPRKYSIDVRTTIRPVREPGEYGSNDELNVHDQVTIRAENFAEIAGILGQFHELAERLRDAE